MSSFIVAVLATCCTGCCSDNLYYEHDAIGLDLTVPIFGQRYGVTIGSVKSTSTAVRGGTSFDSESASGVGLNGSATTTRKTTFRANAQLNEKNIVKVMESPNVDAKAKTALAKQIGDGVVAPDFQPTAMRTRDGVIYANGYRGSHIPNDFTATGIDKIVEDTAGVINGATDALSSATDTVIGGATSTVNGLTKNLAVTKLWAAISTIALCLLSALLFRKKKGMQVERPKKKTEVPDFPNLASDPAVDKGDEASGIVDVPEVEEGEFEPPTHHETKKSNAFVRFFKGLFGLLGLWFSVDEGTRKEIIDKIKKNKKK